MPWEIKVVSAVRVLAAGAMLLLSPLASFAGNTTNNKSFVGAYFARVAKTAPSMSVSLGEDGTATVTGDPGTGSTTTFGHWTSEGNQVKVTFDAEADQPAATPMVFEASHNQLKAVTWDHADWGKATPPVMGKGYKVKYLFWSTSMR
jgi:hypothetical protein